MNYLMILIFTIFLTNLITSCKCSNDLSSLSLIEFNLLLEEYDYSLVFFYSSDNCTSIKCRQAIDINRNLADELKSDFRKKNFYKKYDEFVKFIDIDCSQNKRRLKSHHLDNELCNAYSAIDLPEWVLFRFGTQLKRLTNIDNKSDLLETVKQLIKAISIRFHSVRKLISFLKQSQEPVVIGLFENIEDRLAIDRWLGAIEKTKLHWNYKHVLFCHLFKNYSDGNLNEFEDFIGEKSKLNLPTLIIARQKKMIHRREKRFLSYEFSSNKEDISDWIKRKIFGLIIWRSRDNENEIQHPLIVAYYNFDFKNNLDSSYKWRNLIYDLAVRNPDLNFALSSSHTFRKYLNKYQLTVEDYEPLFIAYDVFHYGYKFDDIFSEFEFNEFLNGFRACNLEPIHDKSSKVNLHQTDNQIIELSTKTFARYVLCKKKDVFIHVYANWCKHCEASKLAVQEMHSRIREEDELIVAQFDAGSNELPPKLEVETFPTFFLFRSSDGKILKYDSTKNIVMIIDFLASQVTKELVAFDRSGRLRTSEEQVLFMQKNLHKNVLNKMTNEIYSIESEVNAIKNEL